jgi:hypothetical protein
MWLGEYLGWVRTPRPIPKDVMLVNLDKKMPKLNGAM